MNNQFHSKVYRSAPDVYWAVEAGCTLVVDDKRRQVIRLVGLEQLIWDCLVIGYQDKKLLQMVVEAGKLTPTAAGRELQTILADWRYLGLVVEE